MHYNLLDFKITDHFRQRAYERYNVNDTELQQFLLDNSPIHDVNISLVNGRITALSDKGNMFILDVNRKLLLTVYPSVNPAIANSNKELFDAQLASLIQISTLKTAQDMMQAIIDNTTKLAQNIHKLQTESIQNLSIDILQDIQQDMSMLKTTMRIISQETGHYTKHQAMLDDKKNEPTHEPTPKEMNIKVENSGIKQKEIIIDEPIQQTHYDKEQAINSALIRDKQILKDILTSKDKVKLHNWLTMHTSQQVATHAAKLLKESCTQTTLELGLRPQLNLVKYNQFKTYLQSLINKRT